MRLALTQVFYFMHRAIVAIIRQHQESVYWNWDNGGDDVTIAREVINTDVESLSFPQDFLFGVATSAHQIEGGGQCDRSRSDALRQLSHARVAHTCACFSLPVFRSARSSQMAV